MRELLLVGTGSFLGGILRFSLGSWLAQPFSADFKFPMGTFGVNFIGCLLAGLIAGLSSVNTLSDNARLFIFSGFLGGFTTFSAFSHETFLLIRSELWQVAALYIFLSVTICIFAVWLGFYCAEALLAE